MKLYELNQNYMNMLELLENPEIPEEVIQEGLNKIGEDIDLKVENMAKLIRTIDLQAKAYKEEEKRIANNRKVLENKVKNLKSYIQESMISTNKKKIKGNIFTLSIQKNAPSVNITDLDNIPDEYKKKEIVITPDKKAIKDLLKQGEIVEGAELKQTESLRIR